MPSGQVEEGITRKNKRGRPPKANKNDTPSIERRRRQLREAQRAYRQRQDSSATELRQRVATLSGTIRKLRTTFSEYVEQSKACSMTDSQTALLQDATAKFEAILKPTESLPDTEETSDTRSFINKKSDRSDSGQIARVPLIGEHVPTWMDKSVESAGPRQYPSTYLGNGYSICDDIATSEEDKPVVDGNDFWDDLTLPTDLDISSDDYEDYGSLEVPTPGLPLTMAIVDTTFGRRLHRAILLYGHRLLLNHKQYPLTMSRVFEIPFTYHSIESMAARFRKYLTLGAFDDLDVPGRPLIHVGGAGTHYPKRDAYGISWPRRKAAMRRAMLGLEGFATLDPMKFDDRIEGTEAIDVDIAGYQGDWLDPYDVEGYLLEKGIGLDIGSSLLECEAVDHSSPRTTPITPECKPFDEEQIEALRHVGVDPNIEIDRVSINGVGGSSCLDHDSKVGHIQVDDVLLSTQQIAVRSEARTVFLDVDKLVQTLVHSCICLGSCPGLRKGDVDRALVLASFDPFTSMNN